MIKEVLGSERTCATSGARWREASDSRLADEVTTIASGHHRVRGRFTSLQFEKERREGTGAHPTPDQGGALIGAHLRNVWRAMA